MGSREESDEQKRFQLKPKTGESTVPLKDEPTERLIRPCWGAQRFLKKLHFLLQTLRNETDAGQNTGVFGQPSAETILLPRLTYISRSALARSFCRDFMSSFV